MVTLAGSQNFSEFELHARAILGLPIPGITLERTAASAVVLADSESSERPVFTGLRDAAAIASSDLRIFGKPSTRKYRRMAVGLAYDAIGADIDKVREVARKVAACIKVH